MNIQKDLKVVSPGTLMVGEHCRTTSSVSGKILVASSVSELSTPVAEPAEATSCNDSVASMIGEPCRTTRSATELFQDAGLPPIELHPFEPFLPINAKVLMLGSFPPQAKRWSMEFYYPNFINDMWRILGLIFFGDKNRFVDIAAKKFKLEDIVDFCTETGIAMYDTATAVHRLKDNASDKFLEVVTPTDIPALLREIPKCQAIVTTGEKATETLCQTFGTNAPTTGEYSEFNFENRPMRLYRMPSSSRAYPLSLEKKAAAYRRLFSDLGMV